GDEVGAIGIDPQAVVVVAAGRAAEGLPRLPAVGGLPADDAGGEDDVGVLGVDLHLGEVGGALGDPLVVGDLGPALAGVVGAVEPAAGLGLDGGEEPRRQRRRHGDADAAEAVGLERR